jgi:DNA-binding NarL/FixJ family response regulator
VSDVVLTDLQQHMVRELVKGKRLKEIGAERGTKPGAAEAVSKMLLRKLGLRTQFQLGAWAERHGYGVPTMVELPAEQR